MSLVGYRSSEKTIYLSYTVNPINSFQFVSIGHPAPQQAYKASTRASRRVPIEELLQEKCDAAGFCEAVLDCWDF
jgi:hypothetical protein